MNIEEKYKAEACAPEERTTVMLRGLPRRCTQETLLNELDSCLGKSKYNFFYLPWDINAHVNMGFAFVNCVDVESTQRLFHMCLPASDVSGPRKIKVVYAHVQGLALNVAHYIGCSVAEDGREHQPVVFENGRRVSFNEAVLRFVPPELAAERLREVEAAYALEPPRAPNSFPGRNIS